MQRSKEIYAKAKGIIKNAGTRDMRKVAQNLGLTLYFEDNFKDLLGMYTCAFKIRAIFVNNRLSEEMKQMVIAHEIGHDVLHRELAKNGALKEFALFDMLKNTAEYEANTLAAHLLIDTEEFLALARDGHTVAEAATILNTDINIALIKQGELVNLGYDLRAPESTRGNFMKKIKL